MTDANGRHFYWQERGVILLLLLIGFALRFYGLGAMGLWGDEIAQAVWSSWDWARLWQEFRAPPDFVLHFVLVHLAQNLGTSEFFVRLPSAITSLLTVPLTYVVARRLTDRTIALAALGLMAVAPYQIWYAQEARMYATLACCALVSLYFFLNALDVRRMRVSTWGAWLGLTIGNTLALYTHLFGVFPIICEAVIIVGWLGVTWLRARRVTFPRCALLVLASFLVTIILALPLASGTLPYVLQGAQPAVSETIAPLVRFQFTIPFLWELLGNFGLGAGEFWRTILSLAGALVGLGFLLFKRPRAAWVALMWLALPLVLLAIVQPKHTVAARYLIFLQPIYLFLLASAIVYGARTIAAQIQLPVSLHSNARLAAVICAAIVALVVIPPLNALYARAKLNDWRALAAYIEQHAQAGDLVFGEKNTPNMNALTYYLPNLTRYSTPPTTLETMQTAANAERRIWYISVGDYFDKEGDVWARQTFTPIPAVAWHDPNLVYEPQDGFIFPQSESPATIFFHDGKFPAAIAYNGKQGFAPDGPAQVRLEPQAILEAELKLQGAHIMELEFASKKPAQFDVMVNGQVAVQVRATQAEKGQQVMQWLLPANSDVLLVQVKNVSAEIPLFVRRISLKVQ